MPTSLFDWLFSTSALGRHPGFKITKKEKGKTRTRKNTKKPNNSCCSIYHLGPILESLRESFRFPVRYVALTANGPSPSAHKGGTTWHHAASCVASSVHRQWALV